MEAATIDNTPHLCLHVRAADSPAPSLLCQPITGGSPLTRCRDTTVTDVPRCYSSVPETAPSADLSSAASAITRPLCCRQIESAAR